MPLKDRLWKFRKRHRIHFFLIEFSIFSRINSAAKIFPLPTSHTHITPCPPSLPSSLLLSLCAIKWIIHETFKDDQITSYRPCLIAESGWKRRCQSPAPHPSYHWNPTTWLNTKFDCTYTHTLTHSHTHTLTHSHTLPLTQTHSHPNTFSRRNARACGGACYTLEACMNYLQT